jgi:hypothetical protein
MSWSKPETKGTVPLPRSLHTASVIGNKYGIFACFFAFALKKKQFKKDVHKEK